MSGILLLGLLLAQLFSLAIDALDRGRAFYRSTTLQVAKEIADIAKSLDAVGPGERARIAAALSGPSLKIALSRGPGLKENLPQRPYARAFRAMLGRELGKGWPIRVMTRRSRGRANAKAASFWEAPVNALDRYLTLRLFYLAPRGLSFEAEVALHDSSLARFTPPLPYEHVTRLYVLLPKLFLMLSILVLLLLFAVGWVTRPLENMARAALALGKDLNRTPLAESGPEEIRVTARALNVMQLRLLGFVRDRAAMLAALSHDLKTFITRLRLRAELLEEDRHRDRLIADLGAMSAMVEATLDYLHGIEPVEGRVTFDMTALVESVRIDAEDLGWKVEVCGMAKEPFFGNPQDLRRCLVNLVENAVTYGGGATVVLEERPRELAIAVCDQGPGVAPDEREKVFEPFYRGACSRARDAKGTGLGLAIARTIARAHGGDVVLESGTPKGFRSVVRLPRLAAAKPETEGAGPKALS